MNKEYIFLFCTPGYDANAYFITPDPEGHHIQHQFGCVGCRQFKIDGTIEKVENPILAGNLIDALGCNPWPPSAVKLNTGLDCVEVWGEGLALLSDGRYVAVNNCD